MDFGPFALLSLFYAVLGVRVVAQLARGWRETFDRRFTPADRALVDQAAFFVLVPVSVALHELGHAVAILALGGRILSWGYYGFAGFVGYDPTEFTNAERIVVAAAGTLVNLLLAAVAVGLVLLRRPPLRAAVNELLLQFTLISLLNALVVYPLLDFATGLNGDWTQMYDGGVPPLSAAILVLHAGLLGGLFWASRAPRVRARLAALTEAPPPLRRVPLARRPRPTAAADGTEGTAGAHATGPAPRIAGGDAPERGVTGALREAFGRSARSARDAVPGTGTRSAAGAAGGGGAEAALREAAVRVASGWPAPVEAAVQARPDGTLLLLAWRTGDVGRTLFAWAPTRGDVELSGAAVLDGLPPTRRPIGRHAGPPDPDRLTLPLRLAMESIDAWPPGPTAEPTTPDPTGPSRGGQSLP